MQLLRKISARTVYGSKADIQMLVLNNRSEAHPLFRVIGVCNGSRKGSSADIDEETAGPAFSKAKLKDWTGPMRDWTALIGAFQATNKLTGEVFRSGVCFLPNYVVDSILGQLTTDVREVEFAFDISARYDETSATSYVYEATSLIEPTEADPVARLSAKLNAAITAPKTLEQHTKEKAGAKK